MRSLIAHITEPAGVDRRRWPITSGVPFSQGEVRSENQITLECSGQPLPCHWEIRARWPDGSIRWTLLDTQVNVDASSSTECEIRYGSDVCAAPASKPSTLQDTQTPESIHVNTGVAEVSIGRHGQQLLTAFSIAGRSIIADSMAPQLIANTGSPSPIHGQIEDAVIEERNPMRLVVCVRGHYARDDAPLLGWQVRMHFFLNHSYIKLYHTIVHDSPLHPTINLRSLRLSLPLELYHPVRGLLGSIVPAERGCGPRQSHDPTADVLTGAIGLMQTQPKSHQVFGVAAVPQVQIREANCFGWIHLTDQRLGVTAKLVRPWQSSPMALSVDDSILSMHLYPDLGRPGLTAMDATSVADVPLNQGVAKTHELVLHVGPPCSRFLAADQLAIGFEHPLLLSLPGDHWAETAALGSFQALVEPCWSLEAKLGAWSRVPSNSGFLEAGGCEDSEEEIFGLARSLLMQHLRSHEQSLFWRAQELLFHSMDAGTCHFNAEHPEWIGGPYRPNQIGITAPSAEFARIDGLIDFYFLTGYRRAYEVAEACADFCRRTAPYGWREEVGGDGLAGFGALSQVGNALNAIGTFFAAFPEERFLRSMEAFVDLLETWQDADGRWSHPIGLHRSGAEPALTASILEGLIQYHAASGDERAQRMATDGALYLANHGRTPGGLFYEQQSPANLRPCNRSLALLPALLEAFERTGEAQLMDAGFRMFRWAVHGHHVAAAHLKDLIAFMPLLVKMNLLEEFIPAPLDAKVRLREPWLQTVVSGNH